MWLARDYDGKLYIYFDCKPVKDEFQWIIPNYTGDYYPIDDFDKFSDVQWSDEEPRELVLKPIKEE